MFAGPERSQTASTSCGTPHVYLHHRSELGEFWLPSDAVIPSFTRDVRMAHIINQIPPVEQDAFNRIGYTIGGMVVFPGHRVGVKMTINGARGFHPPSKDRCDLTAQGTPRDHPAERGPPAA